MGKLLCCNPLRHLAGCSSILSISTGKTVESNEDVSSISAIYIGFPLFPSVVSDNSAVMLVTSTYGTSEL